MTLSLNQSARYLREYADDVVGRSHDEQSIAQAEQIGAYADELIRVARALNQAGLPLTDSVGTKLTPSQRVAKLAGWVADARQDAEEARDDLGQISAMLLPDTTRPVQAVEKLLDAQADADYCPRCGVHVDAGPHTPDCPLSGTEA